MKWHDNEADCGHVTLKLGSGDYYVFCEECSASWVRRPNGGGPDVASPESANNGVGRSLSGQLRVTQDNGRGDSDG